MLLLRVRVLFSTFIVTAVNKLFDILLINSCSCDSLCLNLVKDFVADPKDRTDYSGTNRTSIINNVWLCPS